MILFAATGAFQSLLFDNQNLQAANDGSLLTEVLWILVYLIIAVRAVPLYRQIVALLRANKFIVLLVLLAIVSIAWSVDSGLTLRRSISLVGGTLIGIDFALHHSIREQLRLLYVVLGLFVFLSIIVQVFFPGLIPHGNFDADAWHGIVSFKGNFAKIVVLATVAMLCRPRRSLTDFVVVTALTALGIALILAAHSVEGLVIMAGMLVFFGVSGALRWKPRLLTLAALACLAIAIPTSYFALHNLEGLTAMLGRDSTLTGRTTIWSAALSSIARSPVYGYGYSAFWALSAPEATRIREVVKWETPHAHNGYIDLTLELGLAGLLLFFAGYVVAARRAIQFTRTDAGNEAKWPLAFLLLICVYQFTESSVVVGNWIFWIMYVAVSFALTEIRGTYEVVHTLEIEHIPMEPLFADHVDA
jgi:exopolysaccharide production protein ExoQ